MVEWSGAGTYWVLRVMPYMDVTILKNKDTWNLSISGEGEMWGFPTVEQAKAVGRTLAREILTEALEKLDD